ncbi:MAG: response regulator transcription factor [Chloroflexi bacterium]|nr:DNA-binding response regulator [Anaerolinea sp.]TDA66757.1 MAG: response regulator transcription factor [Chloroflexota bacterium]
MKTERIKLMVVDDHTIFREGLISLLRQQPDFEVVGEAGLVKEAIAKAASLRPDLILMDIGLPDGSGLEATREIVRCLPDISIVILTILESDELLFDAFHCGARGYLIKNTSITKLLASLRGLQSGEAALSRKQTSKILDEFYRLGKTQITTDEHPDILTHREMEVLEQMGAGASNLQIAEKLVISENTVKNHVHNILHKLKLKNRYEAAEFARRHLHILSSVEAILPQLMFYTLLLNNLFLNEPLTVF